MQHLKNLMHIVLVTICLTLFSGIGHSSGVMGFSATAHAAVVRSISVRGNQRMDSDTIISYLTIRLATQFDQSDIDESLKQLFATKLFSDVSIYQNGNILIVEVDERPTVNQVFFEGNKRLKDAHLSVALRTQPHKTHVEEMVTADVILILEAHKRVGYHNVSVTSRIVELEKNRVNVVFDIFEGAKTKIAKISFSGNKTFSDYRLRDVIRTHQTNLLSFLSNDDIYDPDKLRADEGLLQQFYYNHGFADFELISSVANLDDEKNRYSIIITVDEGDQYRFSNIEIDSSIPEIGVKSLYSLLETKSGEIYNAQKIERSIIALSSKIAESGYAFAKVTSRSDRDFEKHTILISYLIDQGPRVYIEHIEIEGNTRTRDYVIRREFDLSEGDALNQALVQRTKRRLETLGIFQGIKISTRPGSSPDRVILTVKVLDGSTASFTLGGGYSTTSGSGKGTASSGFVAEVSFSEKNFLGRGQFLKMKGGFGYKARNYNMSFTEPYFLGREISAGFAIDLNEAKPTTAHNYTVNSKKGTIFFGLPLTEKTSGQLFYTYRKSDIKISDSLKDADTKNDQKNHLSEAIQASEGKLNRSTIGYSLTHNSLDSQKISRSGTFLEFSHKYSGIGSRGAYMNATISARAYHLISAELDLIGMLRGRAGHIMNFGSKNYRVLDNFFQGGETIRGFSDYGFGPRDSTTGDALGGRTYFNGTAELQFPMPLFPESFGLRGALFTDVGTLFGIDSANAKLAGGGVQITDRSVRVSMGASIIWNSPMGPLRFDFARALRSKPWDKKKTVHFGIQSRF